MFTWLKLWRLARGLLATSWLRLAGCLPLQLTRKWLNIWLASAALTAASATLNASVGRRAPAPGQPQSLIIFSTALKLSSHLGFAEVVHGILTPFHGRRALPR